MAVSRSSIFKNGLYNSIGSAIQMLLSILIIPVLIRGIGLDEYGLWTLVASVFGLVELAEAGLSVSTTYFVSRDLADAAHSSISQTLTVTVGVLLVMATLAAGLLWGSAGGIVKLLSALSFSQQAIAAQALRIGALIVWTDLLRRVLIGIEQAYQRYDLINVLVTGQAILYSLGLLLIALLGGKVLTLVWWQAALSMGALVAHLGIVHGLLRDLHLRPAWEWGRVKEVVRYSGLTWLVSLSSALFSKADRLVIGASLGTEVLAVYGAITSVTGKINHLSAVPVQPLLPAISALAGRPQRDQELLQEHVQQAVRFNVAVALGLSAMLFVFAPWVMQILLADAVTADAILALRLAVIIYGAYSLNAVGYYVLLGVNAVPQLMGIQMGSAILALTGIGLAAHAFGLLGAIVGNAGYLGTLWLLAGGMKRLDLRFVTWGRWLVFPLAWFLVTLGLGMILPSGSILWALIVGGVALLILGGWFIKNERTLLESWWHSRGFQRRTSSQ